MIAVLTFTFLGSLILMYLMILGVLGVYLANAISREEWDEVGISAFLSLAWIALGSGIALAVTLSR